MTFRFGYPKRQRPRCISNSKMQMLQESCQSSIKMQVTQPQSIEINRSPYCAFESSRGNNLHHDSNGHTRPRRHCRPCNFRILNPLAFVLILSVLACDFSRTKPFASAQLLQLDANGLPICQVPSSFNPELLHNTGSYGNLFDIQTKDYPVE